MAGYLSVSSHPFGNNQFENFRYSSSIKKCDSSDSEPETHSPENLPQALDELGCISLDALQLEPLPQPPPTAEKTSQKVQELASSQLSEACVTHFSSNASEQSSLKVKEIISTEFPTPYIPAQSVEYGTPRNTIYEKNYSSDHTAKISQAKGGTQSFVYPKSKQQICAENFNNIEVHHSLLLSTHFMRIKPNGGKTIANLKATNLMRSPSEAFENTHQIKLAVVKQRFQATKSHSVIVVKPTQRHPHQIELGSQDYHRPMGDLVRSKVFYHYTSTHFDRPSIEEKSRYCEVSTEQRRRRLTHVFCVEDIEKCRKAANETTYPMNNELHIPLVASFNILRRYKPGSPRSSEKKGSLIRSGNNPLLEHQFTSYTSSQTGRTFKQKSLEAVYFPIERSKAMVDFFYGNKICPNVFGDVTGFLVDLQRFGISNPEEHKVRIYSAQVLAFNKTSLLEEIKKPLFDIFSSKEFKILFRIFENKRRPFNNQSTNTSIDQLDKLYSLFVKELAEKAASKITQYLNSLKRNSQSNALRYPLTSDIQNLLTCLLPDYIESECKSKAHDRTLFFPAFLKCMTDVLEQISGITFKNLVLQQISKDLENIEKSYSDGFTTIIPNPEQLILSKSNVEIINIKTILECHNFFSFHSFIFDNEHLARNALRLITLKLHFAAIVPELEENLRKWDERKLILTDCVTRVIKYRQNVCTKLNELVAFDHRKNREVEDGLLHKIYIRLRIDFLWNFLKGEEKIDFLIHLLQQNPSAGKNLFSIDLNSITMNGINISNGFSVDFKAQIKRKLEKGLLRQSHEDLYQISTFFNRIDVTRWTIPAYNEMFPEKIAASQETKREISRKDTKRKSMVIEEKPKPKRTSGERERPQGIPLYSEPTKQKVFNAIAKRFSQNTQLVSELKSITEQILNFTYPQYPLQSHIGLSTRALKQENENQSQKDYWNLDQAQKDFWSHLKDHYKELVRIIRNPEFLNVLVSENPKVSNSLSIKNEVEFFGLLGPYKDFLVSFDKKIKKLGENTDNWEDLVEDASIKESDKMMMRKLLKDHLYPEFLSLYTKEMITQYNEKTRILQACIICCLKEYINVLMHEGTEKSKKILDKRAGFANMKIVEAFFKETPIFWAEFWKYLDNIKVYLQL